jgi:hypothetical protein
MQGLRAHADDPAFQARWAEVKGVAKAKAMARIQELTGEALPAHAMLDIQVGASCGAGLCSMSTCLYKTSTENSTLSSRLLLLLPVAAGLHLLHAAGLVCTTHEQQPGKWCR